MYDSTFSKLTNRWKSYDEFLNKMMEMFGERAARDGDRVVVRSDKYHYEFAFLYNLVITNRLGQKLFKKFDFEVKPTSIRNDEYKINNLYER